MVSNNYSEPESRSYKCLQNSQNRCVYSVLNALSMRWYQYCVPCVVSHTHSELKSEPSSIPTQNQPSSITHYCYKIVEFIVSHNYFESE